MEGLPTDSPTGPRVYSLDVNGGRLFAGLELYGIYIFDSLTHTWSSAGLDGLSVYALLSYKSTLFAGTRREGIYCAVSPMLQPHGKRVLTWSRVKQGTLTKD